MSGVPTVAVIGGGFTGAAVAFHLARNGARCAIVVYEPRAVLGAGLAYDTDEPVHRINVPASRMTLEPDDPEHFADWLASHADEIDPAARMPDGRIFPRRAVFGRYVAAQVRPLLDSGAVRHVRARVVTVTRAAADGWRIVRDDGAADAADVVVVATSHPAPVPPSGLAGVAGDPRLIADPLVPGALDRVAPDARVLIVGTGLTMADTVAALDRRGHVGPIVAVSRRGQRSRGHAISSPEGIGDFATAPATTALALLARVRAEVRAAAARGEPSHGVINALRRQGGAIWGALPPAERARLVRHLKPFWDTHRFRIAPQVETLIDRRITRGTLAVFAATAVGATATGAGLLVQLARRGGATEEATFDAVVVTTGPGHGTLVATQSFLAGLAGAGHLRGDALRLGLDCDADGRAVGADGRARDDLLVAGPLARGTVGELMGVREVTAFARTLAATIAARLPALRDGGRRVTPDQGHRVPYPHRGRAVAQLSIVGVSGSPSPSSSTRKLIVHALDRIASAAGHRRTIIDVPTLPGLAVTERALAGPELEEALAAVERADLLVVGSPVYKGSYTGLFKHFVDLVEYKALIGVPVALLATGGSDRHAMVIEHQLRPLFAFFQADVLSTGLFVTANDFVDGHVVNPACSERFERLVFEAANALDLRARRATYDTVAA